MSRPKFKVCVECETYNHELYIEDALRGFVSQETDFPFVCVVYDDASTDKTASVIKCFFEENFDSDNSCDAKRYDAEYGEILFAPHKTNKNCYFAIVLLKENHYSQRKSKHPYALEWKSEVEYIAICEGDDFWTDPLKLEKQITLLDQHEDFVMCCTAFTYSTGTQKLTDGIILYENDTVSIQDLLGGFWIGTMTVVFRYGAIQGYKAPYSFLPMGDLPLWCYFSLVGKIGYLKEITSNYRSLLNSASHSTELKKQSFFFFSELCVKEYYAKQSGNLEILKEELAKKSGFFLIQCFKNKWFDFPIQELWRLNKDYRSVSWFDKLRYWGLQSDAKHRVSQFVLSLFGK